MDAKESVILLIHAIIVYFVCFAVMGISIALFTIDIALIVHAIAAPFVSALFAYIYYKKFNHASPIVTAAVFLATVILLDFFLTATIILQDYAMFYSLIGTWVPFALIFTSALLVGIYTNTE